jgi:multicomponent Na+:H+ antiporter subunit B
VRDLLVLRVIARWNIPFMLVFGLYIQTHGEIGPGGGFQAGVVIAAAFILYGIVWGAPAMRKIIPRWFTDWLAASGLLLFAGLGVFSMLMGYEYLDHTAVKPSDTAAAEVWGIIIAEWGVGMTVTAVMVTIFNEITEGTAPEELEEEAEDDLDRLAEN